MPVPKNDPDIAESFHALTIDHVGSPLEQVDLVLEEDESELDRVVWEAVCRLTLSREHEAECIVIISAVAERSPNMDPSCRNIGAMFRLVRDQGVQLFSIIEEAFEKKQFGRIRRLRILQASVVAHSPNRVSPPRTVDREFTKAVLEKAWDNTYSGEHHILTLNNICTLKKTKHYGNQISIIQSSGYGKSRMVHEQAKLVFTIPFNLRPVADAQDFAYPPADNMVRNCLAHALDLSTVTQRHLKFFASLFKGVQDELRQHQANFTDSHMLSVWWSQHLVGVRDMLYSRAAQGAEEHVTIPEDVLRTTYQEHVDGLKEKPTTSSTPSQSDLLIVRELVLQKKATSALDDLLTDLRRKCDRDPSHAIEIVMYFDEAHSLTTSKPNGEQEKTLYDVLCSVLNSFLPYPVFIIFLSTNTDLAELASPRNLARSARIRDGFATIHAPITETPFDCYPGLIIKPGTMSLKDTTSVEYMAQFGRPLFWTLIRAAGVKKNATSLQVMELAQAKLLGTHNIEIKLSAATANAKLAVVDVLLMLDFEIRREQALMQEASLVASHLRSVFSVPIDRVYLRSGYPSEPIIAEAAFRQLASWSHQKPGALVQILNDNLTSALLDRGEVGELQGRGLLWDAYRRGVEFDHANLKLSSDINYSAGCLLTTFITMLFVDQYADMILDSKPDNINEGPTLREAFKTARVRFTHFGKMADETGTTTYAAWAAFMRCMAISCRNGQLLVDCLVPVLLWDEKLCEHVMSSILVQFKRQKKKGTIAKYSIDEKEVGFFPNVDHSDCPKHRFILSPDSRPYITLIMELGVQRPASGGAVTDTKFFSNIQTKTKGTATDKTKFDGTAHDPAARPTTPTGLDRQYVTDTPSKVILPKAGSHHHERAGHPCYSIFAYGCSPTVYRGIDEEQRAGVALLLRSRDFLGEHARQDPASIGAVRKMKPIWTGGEDCYHWIECSRLRGGTVQSIEGVFLEEQIQEGELC